MLHEALSSEKHKIFRFKLEQKYKKETKNIFFKRFCPKRRQTPCINKDYSKSYDTSGKLYFKQVVLT